MKLSSSTDKFQKRDPLNPLYENYFCADFLTDDYFVDHQLQPTRESAKFWDQWLADHPDKQNEFKEAVYLLEAVQLGLFDYARTYLSDALISELLEQINATNAQSENRNVRSLWQRIPKWAAAACLAMTLGLSGIWWNMRTEDSSYERHTSVLKGTLIERNNTTDLPVTFTLPDGSKIDLGPNSKLGYSQDYNQEDRRVFLTGQATFEVKKDTEKPFLVFANKIVTKVLGTRFRVRAYHGEKEIKVDVESGQVSVFQENKDMENTHSQYRKGLVLLPNQQAVFSLQTEEFNKTLVQNPIILPDGKPEQVQFTYDEVEINDVFTDLEKAYGIPIRFDKEGLAGCQLSASFANMSFEEKLDIVCKTVKATYQRVDGQIIVSGGSCK